ncbi:MAG: GntR family transcriptional regulator [Coriobacteriia bacterium]|nr:GntR family transcriptional regulator [Coriobacteriia bacterium]
MISIDPRDPRPLYEQVVEGFRGLILAGVLQADDKLPSVRSLATQLAINPNTIQRAYRELEAQGLTYSAAGKGSFVTAAEPARDQRKAELLEQFDRTAAELQDLGVTADQLALRLKEGTSS